MPWWEIVGWVGSGILVVSLLQTVIWRLRIINLVGCVVLIAYNAVVGVWPMVGLNVVLAVINIVYLTKAARTRHDPTHFDVVRIGLEEQYLAHVLHRHADDIARFNPGLDLPGDADEAHLVLQGDETVGVVLARIEHDEAHVVLDYAVPQFRNLSPGEFVFGPGGVFAGRGLRRIITPPTMVNPYYQRLGFRRQDESYVLDLGSR